MIKEIICAIENFLIPMMSSMWMIMKQEPCVMNTTTITTRKTNISFFSVFFSIFFLKRWRSRSHKLRLPYMMRHQSWFNFHYFFYRTRAVVTFFFDSTKCTWVACKWQLKEVILLPLKEMGFLWSTRATAATGAASVCRQVEKTIILLETCVGEVTADMLMTFSATLIIFR